MPAIVEEVNDPSLRWWTHLTEITAPTLIIGGGPTSHIPQDKLVEVAAAIPDSTLITIPVGHEVHAADPQAFCDAVLNWLDADGRTVRPRG